MYTSYYAIYWIYPSQPITPFATSGVCELALGEDSSLSRCCATWLQIERMRTECEVMGGLGCRDSLSLYKISRVHLVTSELMQSTYLGP